MGTSASVGFTDNQALFLLEKYEQEKASCSSDLLAFGRMKDYIQKIPQNTDTNPCLLQILSINDVYEIDMLPNYSTCRKLEEELVAGKGITVGVLAGDFVAPSLLSSLDKGHAMVDCMNSSKIDFVCMGTHLLLSYFR